MATTKPHMTTDFDAPVEEPTPELTAAKLGPDFEPAYTVEKVISKCTGGNLVEYKLKYHVSCAHSGLLKAKSMRRPSLTNTSVNTLM